MAFFSVRRRSARGNAAIAQAGHDGSASRRLSADLRRSLRRSLNFQPRLEPLEDRRLLAADLQGRPAEADVILEWNSVLLAANSSDHAQAAPEQGGPILTARAFAIVSAAMYDAFNSVEKIGEAYLVTAPRAGGADSDAAVAQAAHDTLVALYPGQAAAFDAALTATLTRVQDGKSETRGIAVGAYVAEKILAARANDGTDEIMEPGYEPSELPGFHDVDPLHVNQPFYAAGAANVDPFAVPDMEAFAARVLDDGTPEGRLEFLQSDEYTAAYEEIMALGGDGVNSSTERTDEQTVIGIYWGYDGRPGLGTPPRLYNQIVQTIAKQQHNTEAQNARLFALVNIAMADAGLAAWDTKWDLAFWRPILGVRGGDADGNAATLGDPDWTPLGAPASNPRTGESDFTPPFPAYTSGHATFGAAAFQILTRFYGRDNIRFRFVSDEYNGQTVGSDGEVRPRIEREFDSFTEAKIENAQSRIYLGIHWAFDRDEGIAQGDAVADYVFENVLGTRSRLSGQQRHNRFDREDVNDDGECSPIDALHIINEINAQGSGDARHFVDVNDDGEASPIDALMVINRLNSGSGAGSSSIDASAWRPKPPATPTPLLRSIDGTGNNLAHPEWGSTDEQLLRKTPAEYADGVSAPTGADRPSARAISNALAAHSDDSTPNDRDLTAYIYVWGQFLDHDLDLTKSASPTERFNIAVPTGDAEFDANSTGTQVIPLTRSVYETTTGTSSANPRQQLNQITAWIDGSMIYGSDSVRAAALRSFSGGKLSVLSTDVGDLPPLNTANLPIANDARRVADTQLFLAGDVRANENIELTSMHTLFIREHNRLATQIAADNPALTDEEIYQRARSVVIAEIQAITYKEWLPALLGSGALRSYRGYNANVNPSIANEFSTAAFRLHSTINDDVEFFDNTGRAMSFDYVDDSGDTITVFGEIALFEAFSNPTLFRQTGVDGILKYAASTHAEEIDNQLVDSLRNFLFGLPGQGGLDLASLNIQRGRDHGLADYNSVRAAYGMPRVTSFAQIGSDPEVQATLEELYGSVDNIDLWVGGLAEDHVRGSSLGPLFQKIIADQFQRLRDGDRFWYQRVFSGTQLAQLERTTLADIIERNTGVAGLQDNVFFFRAEASGQVYGDGNRDGDLDRGEISLPKVTVELLDDSGAVIATTLTGRDGRYRFTQFPETGDFQVRVVPPEGMIATTDSSQELLVATGDVRIRGVNFGLASTATATAGIVDAVGVTARARAEGGSAASAPVENSGGGTRDAHWRQPVFGNELMTGFVFPFSNLPLSRIVVGSLADLGYPVNPTAADPLMTPGTSSGIAAAAGGARSSISASANTAKRGLAEGEVVFGEWSAAVDYLFGTEQQEIDFLQTA